MTLGKFAQGEQARRAARLKHAKRNKRMDEGNAVKVVRREPKPTYLPMGPHHKSLKHFDLLANLDNKILTEQMNRAYGPVVEQYPKKKRPAAGTPHIPPSNFVTRATKPVGMSKYPTELSIRHKAGKQAALVAREGLVNSVAGLDRLRTLDPAPMVGKLRALYG